MKSFRPLLAALAIAGLGPTAARSATATLLDLNFNTAASYPAYSSPLVTGVPGAGVAQVSPTLPGSPDFASPLFATAPTSGYLALTSNASAVNSSTFWGGWASNVTLATINSPYTAGGLGQSDLSKISFTARVRARGMPANGAVVILELRGSGDNPNVPVSGYKRIRFEPVFLAGNDWTTIGGTLDTAGLTAAQGSTYAFPVNAAQYTALVELSGFNQFGASGYVAYNTPTGASNGGRKNPGFGFTGGIRVEVDDVRLVVTDPATTGYVAPTTPEQLLRNGNFNVGDANWTFFEGAYASTDGWSEDASIFALIPGWSGTPYAGFMQNSIVVSPTNGDFFTATFRARFEQNYRAGSTIVAFMDGAGVVTYTEIDITDEIGPRLGQWHDYRVTFRASPAQLAAMNGAMSFKIQPLNRTIGAAFSSVLIDNVVLSQSSAAAVGPQVAVRIAGASRTDGETATLLSPVIGKTTRYTVRIENPGGADLTVSSLGLTGTGFGIEPVATPFVLVPGASRSLAITAAPTALGALTGSLTVNSNDQQVADQAYVVNLAATAVTLADTFDTAASADELGWFPYASSAGLAAASSYTTQGGAFRLLVDSSADDYPWTYIVSKPFASPGSVDLASSRLAVTLRAQGAFDGLTQNRVQIRLESLNSAGGVTGRIELGAPVDETTAGAAPGSAAYFNPDGLTDRVAVTIPEGGDYVTVGGSLASSGVNTTFDANAPAFRLVVQMTDFDFDLDAGNLVQIDAIDLALSTRPFVLTNGGFEADASDPGAGAAPATWTQFPSEGVSKNVVVNGDALYNAALAGPDAASPFVAYAGSRALKLYGQNYYVGGVWQGPSQTGVVYQEYRPGDTAGLVPGAQIQARAVARVYAIDPLTGGSSFRFGFKYLDAANLELGRSVTTLDAAGARLDAWTPLVANGIVPEGAAKVQLVAEFVQNAATDAGAVYLDDVSIGFGQVAATAQVGGETYPLVWSDEFNGDALNLAHWTPELGGGGWGNNEAQIYTDSPDNLRVAGGSLVIEARKSGSTWTSARIKTQGKRSFRHGKIEFRAKLPSGVGPWPAAWMLGESISTIGWPACGEIDVMEWTGTNPGVIGHATHGPSRFGGNAISTTTPVANASTQFRTYAVVWAPGTVTFSVDGLTTGSWSTADTGNPFEQDFFLLLNLAMGGTYVGNQIDPALSSATYEVDYVRVYQAPAQPPLNAYQAYLVSRGLAADVAFDADADGDGVSEGMRYALGDGSPRQGSGPASLVRSGSTFTYTFDLRDDTALVVTPELSTTLTSWSLATGFTLVPTTGAPEGFVRRVLTVSTPAADRVFLRLRIER